FATGIDGAYTDVLIDSTEKSCVVLIDERRYSRHFKILAAEVAARGIPLVILTDAECYWARQMTPHVLLLPIQPGRAWHSFTAFGTLFNLLLGAVIRARGSDAVYGRIEQITAMRQQFIGFSGPSPASEPAGAAASRVAVWRAASCCSSTTATAWITAAMRAALCTACAETSCLRSVRSCEATQLPQPLMADTATEARSKSIL